MKVEDYEIKKNELDNVLENIKKEIFLLFDNLFEDKLITDNYIKEHMINNFYGDKFEKYIGTKTLASDFLKILFEDEENDEFGTLAGFGINILNIHIFNFNNKTMETIEENYEKIVEIIKEYDNKRSQLIRLSFMVDTPPIEFNGDIVITDPCYFIKKQDTTDRPKWDDYMSFKSIYDYPDLDENKNSKLFSIELEKFNVADEEWEKYHLDDWNLCDYGSDMKAIGFNNYLSNDTLYGDWSCTTYNSNKNKKFGKFCADSGMVGVFLLSEILKYNHNALNSLNKYNSTIIKNFNGKIGFEISDKKELSVVGKGNINFYTKQTEF